MENEVPESVLQTVDVLIQYQKGEINLTQATIIFSDLTGIDQEISAEHIRNLSRDNVIKFDRGRREDVI